MSIVGEAPPLPTPEPWMRKGLCRQRTEVDFFPNHKSGAQRAKRICEQCPVIDRCRQYALDHNERHGIWGATTENERRRLQTSKRVFHRTDCPCAVCTKRRRAS